MKTVFLFNYKKEDEEERLMGLLSKELPQLVFTYFTEEDDFYLQLAEKKPALVLFAWNSYPWPTHFIEDYFQRRRTCGIRLNIYYSSFKDGHSALLKEYDLVESVNINEPIKKKDLPPLVELIRESIFSERPSEELQRSKYKFFHYLHNQDFFLLFNYLDSFEKSCQPIDASFFSAIAEKHQKNYDKAYGIMKSALNMGSGVKYFHLMGTILLAIKRYREAAKYFKKADQLSPLNLQRQYHLHVCYNKLRKNQEALKILIEIQRACPNFKRINEKIVQFVFQNATNAGMVEAIPTLLSQVEERELIKYYLKIPEHQPIEIKRKILSLLITEFSTRARKYMDESDFGQALKCYSHVKRIIDPQDLEGVTNLNYNIAKSYYKFGHYEEAKIHMEKALAKATEETDSKLSNLDRLIRKALLNNKDNIFKRSGLSKRAQKTLRRNKKKSAFDVRIVNFILSSALYVFKEMVHVELSAGKPFYKKKEAKSGDISGLVELNCKGFMGSLSLTFSEKTFLQTLSFLWEQEVLTINKEYLDAAGEIINTIFGQAKIKINELGYQFHTVIPHITHQPGHQVKHKVSSKVIVVPFAYKGKPFCQIEVCGYSEDLQN